MFALVGLERAWKIAADQINVKNAENLIAIAERNKGKEDFF